jgi:hypothetical protein
LTKTSFQGEAEGCAYIEKSYDIMSKHENENYIQNGPFQFNHELAVTPSKWTVLVQPKLYPLYHENANTIYFLIRKYCFL